MRRAPDTPILQAAAVLALLGASLVLVVPATAGRARAPTIRLTGHPHARVTGRTATIRFRATGKKVVVSCRIDGNRAHHCQSPLRITGLAAGKHRLLLRATNRWGHASVTTRWSNPRSFAPIVHLPVTAPATKLPPATAPPYTTPVYDPPRLPGTPVVPPAGFEDPLPPAPRPPSSPDTGAGAALSVALASPVAGATLSGFTTLTATASAETGRVAWVDFLVDGDVVGSDTTAPYSFRLPAGDLGAGPHAFAALAVDTSFDRATSASVVATAGTTAYTRDVSTASAFVQAVHDLASSGGSIHLEPGTYQLSAALEIGSDIDIVGSGAGLTTIQAAAGTTADLLRFDNAHDTSLRDATIDYNGGTQSAIYVNLACYDNLFQRLSVIGLASSRFGIQSWQQPGHDFSIQDSVLDGSSDGVTPGGSTGIVAYGADPTTADDSAFRNVVRNFKDFGIEFADRINGADLPGERFVAVENTISDISNPATANGQNEAGIWLGGQDGIAYRNVVTDTGWELIWTGTNCYRCLVRENALGSATYGVYLEHSSDGTTIEGNTIANVSFGVNIEWSYLEGALYRGTVNAVIRGNTITTLNGTGIQGSVSDDGLIVDGNTIRGSKTPVALQALQHATVENNDLRDPGATYCVYEWGIDPDQSTTIRPSDFNTITGNDCRGVTKGVVYHLNAVDGVNDSVSGNLWP